MRNPNSIPTKNRILRTIALATLPAVMAAACSSSVQANKPAGTSTAPTVTSPETKGTVTTIATTIPEQSDSPGLKFEEDPKTNFSVSDCNKVPDTWAVEIDSSPEKAQDYPFTVGLVRAYNTDKSPDILAGATVQGLGNYTYKLATSDAPRTTKTIHIRTEPYSEVLHGLKGKYDAVFTARYGEDGSTYLQVNCLPDFDYSGEQNTVPLPSPEPGPAASIKVA